MSVRSPCVTAYQVLYTYFGILTMIFFFIFIILKIFSVYSYSNVLNSNFGVINVKGADAIQFLHALSTNDISSAKFNDVVPSMLLNGKAKCISYFRCLIDSKDSLRLICDDSNATSNLLEYLVKYRFPLDKVQLDDITDDYKTLCISSSTSSSFSKMKDSLNLNSIENNCFVERDFGTIISGDGGLSSSLSSSSSSTNADNYTLLVKCEKWIEFKNQLNLEEEENDENDYEFSRILAGKPKFPNEINEDRCPLDLGLLPALHFEKGCFTGNEILQKRVQRPIPQRLCTFTLNIDPSSVSVSASKLKSVLSSLLNVFMNKESETEIKNEVVILDQENKVVGEVTSTATSRSTRDEDKDNVIGLCLIQRTSLDNAKNTDYKLSMRNSSTKEVDIDINLPIDINKSGYAKYNLEQAAHSPKAQSVLETKKMLKSSQEELLEIKRKEEKMKAMMEKVAKLQALKNK